MQNNRYSMPYKEEWIVAAARAACLAGSLDRSMEGKIGRPA